FPRVHRDGDGELRGGHDAVARPPFTTKWPATPRLRRSEKLHCRHFAEADGTTGPEPPPISKPGLRFGGRWKRTGPRIEDLAVWRPLLAVPANEPRGARVRIEPFEERQERAPLLRAMFAPVHHDV